MTADPHGDGDDAVGPEMRSKMSDQPLQACDSKSYLRRIVHMINGPDNDGEDASRKMKR